MSDKKGMNILYRRFMEQAEAISARVYRVSDPAGAGVQLAAIIKQVGAGKMVAARSELVDKCLDVIDAGGIEICTGDLRMHCEDAGLGLSEVDLAIAETGTLVQDSTSINQRLVSTLPPVHVALVRTERLVEYFGDAMDVLNSRRTNLPGYISFISGPSRTADIERVLTIGVHGPEQLHIIFVDEAGDESGD
ncbi:LutC/YkgG family protein [Desulfallas thermosapovorans]|uniref:LutC/YkgG family protein n=1 Tax=Desulfallas thermosapovorans TaxID=58137 RepID=UPI001FAB2ED4|nr:lactate utilization protein [Desulfallas thermosapovorans]